MGMIFTCITIRAIQIETACGLSRTLDSRSRLKILNDILNKRYLYTVWCSTCLTNYYTKIKIYYAFSLIVLKNKTIFFKIHTR